MTIAIELRSRNYALHLIVLLVSKKIKILTKYSDFSDVFLEKKALILPKTNKLNKYIIKLQKSQQLPYRPIYSLGLVKFKMLKTYIKTNLIKGFIWSFKLPGSALIFFV